MDNVTPLRPGVTIDDGSGSAPNEAIVELLRATLVEAERGELAGVALVGVTGTGNFAVRYHCDCNAGSILGAAVILYETIKAMWFQNAMLHTHSEPEPPA